MGAWNFLLSFCRTISMSIKFLVLGGGGLGFFGGGECRFYFYGRGDFLKKSPFSPHLCPQNIPRVCAYWGFLVRKQVKYSLVLAQGVVKTSESLTCSCARWCKEQVRFSSVFAPDDIFTLSFAKQRSNVHLQNRSPMRRCCTRKAWKWEFCTQNGRFFEKPIAPQKRSFGHVWRAEKRTPSQTGKTGGVYGQKGVDLSFSCASPACIWDTALKS